jgi:hypothetical protein
MAEYLVALLIEEEAFEAGFALLAAMAGGDEIWREATARVFRNNEGSLEMLVRAVRSSATDQDGFANLLRCLRRKDDWLYIDVCVLAASALLLPDVFSLAELIKSPEAAGARIAKLLDSGPGGRRADFMSSRPEHALRFMHAIVLELDESGRFQPYETLWRKWRIMENLESDGLGSARGELILALNQCLSDSPRRETLIAFLCNGCFHRNESVQLRCFLVARTGKHPVARALQRVEPAMVG